MNISKPLKGGERSYPLNLLMTLPSHEAPRLPLSSDPTTPCRRNTSLTTVPGLKTPSTPPGGKTRARELLRKHYGLGVGPPPPLGKSNCNGAKSNDPMDLGEPWYISRS